jgi:hypothetical protein
MHLMAFALIMRVVDPEYHAVRPIASIPPAVTGIAVWALFRRCRAARVRGVMLGLLTSSFIMTMVTIIAVTLGFSG